MEGLWTVKIEKNDIEGQKKKLDIFSIFENPPI